MKRCCRLKVLAALLLLPCVILQAQEVKVDDQTIAALISQIGDKDPAARAAAAEKLGETKDPRCGTPKRMSARRR